MYQQEKQQQQPLLYVVYGQSYLFLLFLPVGVCENVISKNRDRKRNSTQRKERARVWVFV